LRWHFWVTTEAWRQLMLRETKSIHNFKQQVNNHMTHLK
jgi:hypothetical protein